MKIIVLGDLHAREDWFNWTAVHAPDFDLIALPGDFTDMFREDQAEQQIFVTEWLSQRASFNQSVAWCSGNHDATRWMFDYPDLRFGACWTDGLRFPSVVGDVESRAFRTAGGELFVVTSLPYGDSLTAAWLAASHRALETGREESGRLKCLWVVLAHEPPADTPAATDDIGHRLGSQLLREWVERFAPSFVLSGHFHQAPQTGRFAGQIGKTWCINPGCDPEAIIPNHVVIDTAAGTATFRGAGLIDTEMLAP